MLLLAVWGAVASFFAGTADATVAILPRPDLPIVGENSPIASLPVAALIALEVAVVIGILQNGGEAITLDEWKRLKDKDNYEYIYDYDYGKPFRRLIYFAASAPDDSEAYFESEEHEEEHEDATEAEAAAEGEGERRRRIFQKGVPPFSHYRPASYGTPSHYGQGFPPPSSYGTPSHYGQGSRPPSSYGQKYNQPSPNRRNSYQQPSSYGQGSPGQQGSYPPPTHTQGSYPQPEQLPYRRYKRDLQGLSTGEVVEELMKAVDDLTQEKDARALVEEVVHLTGQVMSLDKDGCLLKLLCHIQEKPRDARAPEHDQLFRLFTLNAASEPLKCRQEFPQCPVQEAQLAEAFTFTWPHQNTV
ncbi:uncharacterized protein LOC127005203 [Eriocheir sinensis]|uniref:uncharacterized protein LOC127005203 n=1 Tax=Eriocheir sinensis TaxID=95602 RepID=UPI0021C9AAD0|nr:uncharacterized protein LOC127005203 [Eriocheir sinensis]